ncbi:MAG: radical SAM protein [Desulfococcaceae bacterium]
MSKQNKTEQKSLFSIDKSIAQETVSTLHRKKLELIPDIHLNLFNGLSETEKSAWADYLYANPKEETQKLSLKPHIVGLYDPFADQNEFPAGRRWCVNVYTGCAFSCKYCYTISYIRNAFQPRLKNNFELLLDKDLKKIQDFYLHPAPIHISNSTDPLQPLEKIHRHTLLLLKKIKEYRNFFTTITILTKNPSILCEPDYLEVITSLGTEKHSFQVEVTCPFYNDDTRRFFEPGAPKVETRLEGIKKLREKNITVALRIDPIFPRDPLPKEFFDKPALKDYGAPQSQTEKDLEQLIKFASDVRCSRIIISPLKLTTDRFNKSDLVPIYLKLFAAANKGKPIKKGSAFRLPWPLYHHWIEKPSILSKELNIPLIYCKKNLINTF